ncbi:MFS transporter, PPP family, 3-phenylpropionic acid transporter [Andreprevotia lacus DSM 23236]|jgi:PPP family 3-phenylpropionic acid transporter|uniref:MFS transporter, PPP family, 3-phenylpropionic acid transporter n=1 Tax=Andreprevotia lacus DSM 23236 TaxID=1121001 RepID=A0A1W1XJ25_9NEIS|nr:MFS transporter [Andreprevotia lacus]SMC23521.1 MFS transporter, PPP family, 3-phenylpropionic acid transporter [Andreprevotia lacus DSM 23236]
MTQPRTAGLFAIGGFYFCYFAFTGLFQPFWGVYLAALSFPAWQIGILTSLTQINRIYAPVAWGWLADHTGRRSLILRVAGAGAVAGFVFLPFVHGFGGILAAVLFATFFWSAALPLVEALTMNLLKGDGGRYARLRVWGSIGFIVTSIVGGYWMQAFGIQVLPWTVLGVMCGLAAYACLLPKAPAQAHAHERAAGFGEIMARREVQVVFGCCFLMLLSHGPYYSFYSIFVTDLGVAKSSVGWLWALGVTAEVCVFLSMPWLTARWSTRQLFLSCFLVATGRWLLIAFSGGHLALLLLAQLGHAWTFAICHATGMSYVHRHFAGPHQGKGQALYIGASFGLGGSLGGVLAGAAWVPLGGTSCFLIAAGIALLGWLVARAGLREPPQAA